jgi:hypothetical protein
LCALHLELFTLPSTLMAFYEIINDDGFVKSPSVRLRRMAFCAAIALPTLARILIFILHGAPGGRKVLRDHQLL